MLRNLGSVTRLSYSYYPRSKFLRLSKYFGHVWIKSSTAVSNYFVDNGYEYQRVPPIPIIHWINSNSRRTLHRSCFLCSRQQLYGSNQKSSSSEYLDKTNKAPGDVETQKPTENILTIPNALCVLRIGMTPFIANLIIHHQYNPAIGLVVAAGITDLLDGWIARVVPSQSSVCGSFLDPLADKILVATLFISLTYVGLIPVPLTTLIVGRDAILIAFGFYIRYKTLDPPRTLGRYFNIAMPTAQLAPTFISKVNTGLQIAVVGATLMSTVITSIDLHPYLQILWYTTAATTAGSAIYYCFAKDTVKLLKQTSTKFKLKTSDDKKSL